MPGGKPHQETAAAASYAELGRILREQGSCNEQVRRTGVDERTLEKYRAGKTGPSWDKLVSLLRAGVLTLEDIGAAAGIQPAPAAPLEETWRIAHDALVDQVATERSLSPVEVRRRLGFTYRHVLAHELKWHRRTVDKREADEQRQAALEREVEQGRALNLDVSKALRLLTELAMAPGPDLPRPYFTVASIEADVRQPSLDGLLLPRTGAGSSGG